MDLAAEFSQHFPIASDRYSLEFVTRDFGLGPFLQG